MRKFGAKLLEVLRKGDMVLLALCVLTSVFGIVMVAASTAYDGSSRYVIIQTGALITGILLYLALTAFDIDILAGQRTLLFLFNTAFLAMLLVWGVEGTSGNKSWLHFPFLPFNIQPAEVCKITYIIILAKTMSLNRNRISSLRSVLIIALPERKLPLQQLVVRMEFAVEIQPVLPRSRAPGGEQYGSDQQQGEPTFHGLPSDQAQRIWTSPLTLSNS